MEVKRYIPGLLLILALLGLGLFWYFSSLSLAEVVTVSPASGEEDVALSPQGKVVFDRRVRRAEDLALVVSPAAEAALRWGEGGKSLGFSFAEELEAETTYQISLSGPGMVPFSWSFETEGLVWDGVGSSAAAAAWGEYESKNPLVSYMPVVTEAFKISRLGEGVFRVTLYAADKDSARRAVVDWFGEHGVNPDTLEIEWVE